MTLTARFLATTFASMLGVSIGTGGLAAVTLPGRKAANVRFVLK